MRSLGLRTDLALLEHGGSEVLDRGDHLVVRSPHNPTHWWGNFLLLPAVPAAEDSQPWLDRFADEFPTAAHVALAFDGTHGTVGDLEWFSRHGYSAEAQTVMTAHQVQAPRRQRVGATVRELVSDRDWEQSVDLRVRCHTPPPGIEGYREFVGPQAVTRRQLVRSGLGAWFGALIDGRLVAQLGLVSAGAGLARFQSVETDPQLRRQGLAGALVHAASLFGLTQLRASTLVMVADPDYFAIDLYRSLGFVATESQLQIEVARGLGRWPQA